MNELIEQAFSGYTVPVSFLYYNGNASTYITYQQTDVGDVLDADDKPQNYADYYDVDIYSKTNYFSVLSDVITKMTAVGFKWIPSRSSSDMYDIETGYYHKTLSFGIERGV